MEFHKFLKPSETPMFAAAYGRKVSIFRCPNDGQIQYVSCYEDPDVTINSLYMYIFRNENFNYYYYF